MKAKIGKTINQKMPLFIFVFKLCMILGYYRTIRLDDMNNDNMLYDDEVNMMIAVLL